MIDKIQFININNSKQYNSYEDFEFLIKEFSVDEATVKEEIVDIPGSSSFLDFSRSLTGDVNYNRRTINIVLNKRRGRIFLQEYSKLQNALHGQRMKIIHSKDAGFYWIGTVKVGSFDPHAIVSEISVKCEVEAYKYDIQASNEDWLWDPFSFEDGIINETKDLLVDGELEVVIYGRRKNIVPTIICNKAIDVIFNGTIYNLSAGENYSPYIEISEGKNVFKFVGNATVSIEYRGGSL